MPRLASQYPIVLSSFSNALQALGVILNSQIQNYSPTPFVFKTAKGKEITNELRFIYPSAQIFQSQEIRAQIRQFVSLELRDYLSGLNSALISKGLSISDLSSTDFYLRFRLFEDRKGYSLDPHRDSPDTVLSFIFQLNRNNVPTQLYRFKRFFKADAKIGIDNSEKVAERFIKELYPDSKPLWVKNQFNDSLSCWLDNETYLRFQSNDNGIGVLELNEGSVCLEHENLYAIHNVLSGGMFSRNELKLPEICYHGVRPSESEYRRSLIFDLLTRQQDAQVDLSAHRDPMAFFVYFSPSTLLDFKRLLK